MAGTFHGQGRMILSGTLYTTPSYAEAYHIRMNYGNQRGPSPPRPLPRRPAVRAGCRGPPGSREVREGGHQVQGGPTGFYTGY